MLSVNNSEIIASLWREDEGLLVISLVKLFSKASRCIMLALSPMVSVLSRWNLVGCPSGGQHSTWSVVFFHRQVLKDIP